MLFEDGHQPSVETVNVLYKEKVESARYVAQVSKPEVCTEE